MNKFPIVTLSLIFLCAFLGLIGAVGVSEIATDYAILAIEVLLLIVGKLDSKDPP